MGLRKQIKRLYQYMYGVSEKNIDFMISELIRKKFILQHKIENSRTMMLYLSKYPRAQFNTNKDVKDQQVLCFSKNKLYRHIFIVDYIIQNVVPMMENDNLKLTPDSLKSYLESKGSNLLLSCSQYDAPLFYKSFSDAFNRVGITLDKDTFQRDYKISLYDKQYFLVTHQRKGESIAPCDIKLERQKEMAKCRTDNERNKQFFNLSNFSGQGFYFTGYNSNTKTVKIAYFDHMNTIQTKKLWTNVAYTFCMIQRYADIMDVKIHAELFVWDECRKKQLEEDFAKQAYDFYNQEWSGQNKVNKIFQDIGILPAYRQNFKLDITVNNIYEKYNINLN